MLSMCCDSQMSLIQNISSVSFCFYFLFSAIFFHIIFCKYLKYFSNFDSFFHSLFLMNWQRQRIFMHYDFSWRWKWRFGTEEADQICKNHRNSNSELFFLSRNFVIHIKWRLFLFLLLSLSVSPQTTSIIYNDGFCERHLCFSLDCRCAVLSFSFIFFLSVL